MAEVVFPKPLADDSEDIRWALETAGALWARGDAREAIRWIRRAAETASDQANDARAVFLAKTAAELATELNIPPSMPPPPLGEDPPSSTRSAYEPFPVSSAVSASAHDAHLTEFDEGPGLMDEVLGNEDPLPPVSDDRPDGPRRAQRRGVSVRIRQALRVSVAPSSTEHGLLLVRALGEDELPPDGAHEAMLVAVEAGAHLLAKKR